ncbi:MAG TPA: diacylglycerol kinase family protein [Bryobacteraceae bacterium]
MRAHRAVILYNPVARGLLHRGRSLDRCVCVLAGRGIEARLVATTGPGSAGGQARREIETGCDLMIAAGGDGTINEVANGMLHSPVPLAILPGGTANVLAHEMGLPLGLEKAAARIPQLHPVPTAVGRLQIPGSPPRLFLCMTGAGLDAQIVYHLNPNLKATLGKLAYYASSFRQVFRSLCEFEVCVESERFKASFALISRVRNYGGDLEIARGASLLRDDFEVVLFRGTQSVGYLRYLAAVLVGRAHRVRGCTVLRGRSIVCRGPDELAGSTDNIYVQVDGELAGTLPITAEIIPSALKLSMPAEYLARERERPATPVQHG